MTSMAAGLELGSLLHREVLHSRFNEAMLPGRWSCPPLSVDNRWLFKSSSIRLDCGRKGSSSVVAMSGPRHLVGFLNRNEGLRFAVVVARFNEIVTKPLLDGALETFKRYGVQEESIDIISVPGSFEIPVTAQALGKSGKYNAVLCIGAVIRGDTTHYDAVANSAASGVLSASLGSGVPCILCILTCENMDQALNRAGGKVGNKGAEGALTAMEMASLFEHHLKG